MSFAGRLSTRVCSRNGDSGALVKQKLHYLLVSSI
jgi:hypothetical protein